MIRPRPTQHENGTTSGNYFNPFHTIDIGRSEAYCSCGARLSKYRALGDTLCAPCQLTKAATLEPSVLHPDPPIKDRWRNNQSKTCPLCGGVMDRRAKSCRRCLHPDQVQGW